MEFCRKKRLIVRLDAELILNGVSYPGFIGNMSEDGVHMKITSAKNTEDLAPGAITDLRFRIPSGETLSLLCRIKWLSKSAEGNVTCCAGMAILDFPDIYLKLLSGRIKF